MKMEFPVGSGISFLLLFAVFDCLQYEDKFKTFEWNNCHGVCTDGAAAMEGKHADCEP